MAVTQDKWRGTRVLVTGVTGFKGSWLSVWLRKLGADVHGYSLAPPTSPSLFQLADVSRDCPWTEADVRDRARITAEVAAFRPDVVFHLAAQPLVRASYDQPAETFDTNVMGTVNILEAVRLAGGVRAVIVVTSDKCYENREWPWAYRESDRLGGHDPYSSSKACAEIVASSYWRALLADSSTGLATVRAGNVIGGGDWALDRLVPDLVSGLAESRRPIIRNPRSIRPWQHVLDPLLGYIMLAERVMEGRKEFCEAWNFGPSADEAQSVATLADDVCAEFGDGASWRLEESPRHHEAGVLRLDSTKARERLGWRPRLGYREAIRWTMAWYTRYLGGAQPRELTLEQLLQYEALS